MSWNDNNNNKDPWNNEQGPPDLDEALRRLQKRIGAMVGGGNQSNHGDSSSGSPFFFIFVLLILAIFWGLSGIFVLDTPEQAVVQRFGRYVKTVGPGGLHWIPRVIDSYKVVNIERVDTYSYSAEMINKNENILSVALSIHYRVANPKNFLFNVVNPIKTLEQSTASAIRDVTGSSSLDDILTEGRERIRIQVEKQLKQILAKYETGIEVTGVSMQAAQPPEAVKDAFDDVTKAKQDQDRFVSQALAYKADVLPVAKGQAKKVIEEAEAYKEQVILRARGDVAEFEALLTPYKDAPKVTRERMYLATMEGVLKNTTKVLMDNKDNNSLVYLPMDQLLKKQGASSNPVSDISQETPSPSRQTRRVANNYQTDRSILDRMSRNNYTRKDRY